MSKIIIIIINIIIPHTIQVVLFHGYLTIFNFFWKINYIDIFFLNTYF